MSEHTWFQENLAGFLASGLSAEESERFDRHRIACSACSQILADYKGFDLAMDDLFTPVRPAPGMEDAAIEKLRGAAWWQGKNWSWVKRICAGVAALVALGTIGGFLHGFVGEDKLPFPGATSFAAAKAKNELKEIGLGLHPAGTLQPAEALGEIEGFRQNISGKSQGRELADITQANTIEFYPPALAITVQGPSRTHTSVSGGIIGGKSQRLEEEKLGFDRKAEKSEMDAPLSDLRYLAQNQPVGFGTTLSGRTDGAGDQKAGDYAVVNNSFNLDTHGGRLFAGVEGRISDAPPAKVGQVIIVGNQVTQDLLIRRPLGQTGLTNKYFAPSLPVANSSEKTLTDLSNTKSDDSRKLTEPQNEAVKQELAQRKEDEKRQDQPLAGRKIIRTGDIEFEVDNFDAAVANVTRLVNTIPGAFVATVNSDKLPNGKVKGSLVVRFPPEKLDKFLLDVRQELAKTGELKSQRIGSQDVTKQYTDLESRLRGARAMEERFLQIIKTGKGEIKDLIVAENALGVWRTKIEEMEGEIRYYNNQVGLSTLTIALVEKEILAPASLVVTQRIKMQLEVEDVDKAQQAALAAVTEAKGRVTKSELKQHAAGQLEAILHFEVAPALSDKVRDRLKQLGIVTHQDADRTQQTEGNGSQTSDIKIKQSNVKFEVGFYNTANIQPREVEVIQIASLNVTAGFRKLQEAVAKVKGQVRTAQLNEQDKQNVSAQFDFDVPSSAKTDIDQVLAEVGKVSARTSSQAPPGEAATDRKIGYRLILRNVAALPSREKVSLGLEVKDVDQTAADILDTVKIRQGNVAGAQVNHERDGRVSALLVFDVPLSAKDELIRQLKAAGILRVQTSTRSPQVSDNELATAHIDVTLTSAGSIVPEDGFWPQIRTSLIYSFKLLSWSLMFIILGFSVVLPWVLVIWGAITLLRKWRKKPVAGPV